MLRWFVGTSLSFPSFAVAFTAAPMFFGAASAQGPEPPGLVLHYADTVIVNGKIATVDPAVRFVEALAIRDGRVLAAGSRADVERLAGPATKRIDVGGRTVVPGLIDTHAHLHEYALEISEGDIAGAEPKFKDAKAVTVEGTSVEQVLQAIKAVAAGRAPGSWINIQLAATAPTGDFWNAVRRQHLDAVAPNNPLTVRVMGGNWVINTRVLDEVRAYYGGLPDYFEKGAGHADVQLIKTNQADHSTGEPSGRLDYQFIKTIRTDLLIKRPMVSLYNAYKKVQQEWAGYGITTWSSSVEPLHTLPVFREMDRRGDMDIRFGFSHSVGLTALASAPEFYARLGDVEGMGSEHFWPIGAGVYHVDDNANPTATWTLCTTLKAAPEVKAREMCHIARPDDVRRKVLFNAVKYGNRITGTHAAGDAAADHFMDVIEQASAAAGLTLDDIRARSHVIDHCALNPRPDQIERGRRLNIIWSCGPKYVDGGAPVARLYGEAYAHTWVAPVGSILRGGGRVAMEMDTSDVRKHGGPFYYVAKLLHRQDDTGKVWGPKEAIGREDALRMYTIWAAEYVKAENRLGSLEPGKMADLVVLDRDYFSIPLTEFPKIRALLTLVGGKVAYQHSSLPLPDSSKGKGK
jgi:predicted amidohydrolase YtcJ